MIARDLCLIVLLFAVPALYLLTGFLITPMGKQFQAGKQPGLFGLGGWDGESFLACCLIFLILPIAHLPRVIREWRTEGTLVFAWLLCWAVVAGCGYVVVSDWAV